MNNKLSLTELQLIIRDSLYSALPGLYWVSAEISEIKENYAGHCYLELIEKHPDEINIRSKARGIIWRNRLRFIKPMFENITGGSLRAGLKVLMHIKLEYHEIYGLSLVINDIDPAFTLGEMALKRQQIIRRLEDEGVLTMNREVEFPVLPQRIAVISSESAAGYTDFIKHLKGNSYGYVFYTAFFEAVMQGQESEASILDAFERISGKLEYFDVVVIVRGGGSQSDLSWFDNYNIAYHITQFPIPVITGIGHEKDLSVTDIVAYRSEKTPTAVADFLTGKMVEAGEHILNLYTEISSFATSIISEYYEKLTTAKLRLVPLARMMVTGEREKLSSKIIGLLTTGKDYIGGEKNNMSDLSSRLKSGTRSIITLNSHKLKGSVTGLKEKLSRELMRTNTLLRSLSNTLKLLDPVQILKRGYTITSLDGKIVTSCERLDKDDIIENMFYDGKITSRVTGKIKKGNRN